MTMADTRQKAVLKLLWKQYTEERISSAQLCASQKRLLCKEIILEALKQNFPKTYEMFLLKEQNGTDQRAVAKAAKDRDEIEEALKEARMLLRANDAVLRRVISTLEKVKPEKNR